MKSIKSFLTFIDLYGNQFALRFGKNAKYKSSCGGCLTLMVVLSGLFAIIVFGFEFVLRDNVFVNTDSGIYTNENMPFYPENTIKPAMLVIALRTYFAKEVTVSYTVEEQEVTSEPCPEDILPNQRTPGYSYICTPMDKFGYGKEQIPDGEDEEGFPKFRGLDRQSKIKFEVCKGKQECSLKPGQMLFIDTMIPLYTFVSSNYDNPVQLNYEHYKTVYIVGSVVFDNIQLSSFLVEDDKGWLLSERKNTVAVSFASHQINNSTSTFSSFLEYTVKLNTDYTKFYRRYSKIQDLSALIGGFLKIVTTIFSGYNLVFEKVSMNRDLLLHSYKANFLVEMQDGKKKLINPSLNQSLTLANNFTKEGSSEKDKSNLELSNKTNKRSNTVNNRVKIIPNAVKQENSKCIITAGNIVSVLFKGMFRRRLDSEEAKVESCLNQSYEHRDYLYFLKKIREFEVFKHLFLSYDQINLLSLMAKPMALGKNEVPHSDEFLLDRTYSLLGEKKNTRREKGARYLAEKSKEPAGWDSFDKVLYKILEEKTKEKIEKTIKIQQGE